VTEVLAPSAKYDTSAIEDGYLVFGHTNLQHDIRALPDFVPASKYASQTKAHKNEFGAVNQFRFILSPDLPPLADSGAAVGATGMDSTTGVNIDVYPLIVVGADAWGDVALRGARSFDVTDLKPGQKDKSDILGQRGYLGAKFYSAALVTNHGWMGVGHVGITDLDP
jgi:N4-gp56 family major capsid protein